jgi:hypothetical protein
LAVIHLEALVGEDSWQLFNWRLWLEEIVGSYSFGGSGVGDDSWQLFIWRLWLEKRVGSYSFGGSGWRR